jgi:hypothetical protein
MFKSVHALLRTGLLGGLLLIGGWWTVTVRDKLQVNEQALAERDARIEELTSEVGERDARIAELDLEIEEKEAQIQTLRAALDFLKVDHRLARLEVLSQEPDLENPEKIRTTLRFTELGPDELPLDEGRVVVVDGRVVYVETLVIKFDDELVESGDPLRGTSICLFRRLFGEDQSPTEGVPIDAAGVQPLVYAEDANVNPYHQVLWERFWDYANDPDLARENGVRAIHGEAPFIQMRPGRSYRVELRSSGGLTIQAE